MKKILFVGKFNSIIEDNNFLKEIFDVQICVDNAQMVKGLLKLKHPELLVVSLVGISADAEEIFKEIKGNYPKLPVVCIGSDEDVKLHINRISTSQFTTIITPVNKEQILNTICKVLDVTCDDDVTIDNKDGKKSILLVDDSTIQLRALNELLKEKYEVRMATSGMQALTLIGKKMPDMIFLDYEMPMCDGKMTLEMIRGLDEAKNIPVVFLTGVSDKSHIEAVLKLKPAGYLLKPADASRIYDIIEQILG